MDTNKIIKNKYFVGNEFDYDGLYDYTFEDCTFSNLNCMTLFKKCKFINCTFNNSSIEFTFQQCNTIKDIIFFNCKGYIYFDRCNFSNATIFEKCEFKYVNYAKCEVQGILFNYSNVKKMRLINSNLSLVTFVMSEIEKINLFTKSSLKDTIFKACKINNISKDVSSKTSNIDIKD